MNTADELLQAYAGGERKFTYWRLAGAFLHGADLRDANLYGSDLSGADLSGADLSRANLGKADFYNANLSGANLSDAFVEGANFARANMSGVVTDNPSLAIAANQPGAGAVDTMQAGAAAALAAPATVAAPTPDTRFCAFCGSPMPVVARFCQVCGKDQPSLPAPASVPLPTSPALDETGGPLAGSPAQTGPRAPIYHYPSTTPPGGQAPQTAPFVFGAPYVARTTPLQPSGSATTPLASSPFRSTLTQQRKNATGMTIATFAGALAVLAFFLPGYLSAGAFGVSGPQVASLFSDLSSLCSAAAGNVPESVQGACTFAGAAGLLLWLEVILAAGAAGIAAQQWYTQRHSGLPLESAASVAVLLTGGLSLLILLFQFCELPSVVSSLSGGAATGQDVGALFGFSFWFMVLGMIGVVIGASIQLRK